MAPQPVQRHKSTDVATGVVAARGAAEQLQGESGNVRAFEGEVALAVKSLKEKLRRQTLQLHSSPQDKNPLITNSSPSPDRQLQD